MQLCTLYIITRKHYRPPLSWNEWVSDMLRKQLHLYHPNFPFIITPTRRIPVRASATPCPRPVWSASGFTISMVSAWPIWSMQICPPAAMSFVGTAGQPRVKTQPPAFIFTDCSLRTELCRASFCYCGKSTVGAHLSPMFDSSRCKKSSTKCCI